MDEKKEEKKDEGSCGKGGCGMHCGCCVCKTVRGLILLLIGGFIGYWIGHCCGSRSMCMMERHHARMMEDAPMPSAPAAAQKAK